MNPHELPIYQQKERILEALEREQVIVVESPTGSGKTTQLPVILYEAAYAKYGMIGVTQPRRIAAISVSEFIAKQLAVPMPGLVGYKMRFEDKTDASTCIKIMTDGILLQEMKLDPLLTKYSVLMIDEAHERSLTIDFILGLVKRILNVRPEFKVIISSATINAQIFSSYFNDCPIVRIETHVYPVTVVYDVVEGEATLNTNDMMISKIAAIVNRVISEKREGDILIFLPGEKAIKDCMKALISLPCIGKLHLVPLYSRLGKEEQEKVFDKPPFMRTKVVIATNIAETSITIDGVTTVIDSGLSKLNFYNPKTFTSSLIEVPISKASSNQRKGRAGRTQAGTVYRLYSRDDFEDRPLYTTEEIYRTDLTEVVLRMAELGITEFEHFEFIAKPSVAGLRGAVEMLGLFDALEPDNRLTNVGQMMCAFPLLPRLSRMIVEAIMVYPTVIHEVIIAASFLSTSSPYLLPPGEEVEARAAHHLFRDAEGDFVSYLKIFKAFKDSTNRSRFATKHYLDERTLNEILRIHEQISMIVSDLGIALSSGGSIQDYLCAVSRGLIQFVCMRHDRGLFRTLTTEKIQIHPSSVMFRENPSFIVAGEIVRTTRMYAMSVSPLKREWLVKIWPKFSAFFAAEPHKKQSKLQKIHSEVYGNKKELHSASVERSTNEASYKTETRKKTAGDFVRDFTNNIKIGSEVFKISIDKKKKKIIELPWAKLQNICQSSELENNSYYKNLRGLVLYNGYTLLNGELLETIIKVARLLHPEKDLARVWLRNKNFNCHADQSELFEAISHVLQISPPKDKAKTKGKLTKELGFVTLYSDGQETFWLGFSRGFFTSVHESIASLENLIDKLGSELAPAQKETIASVYRKLDQFLAG